MEKRQIMDGWMDGVSHSQCSYTFTAVSAQNSLASNIDFILIHIDFPPKTNLLQTDMSLDSFKFFTILCSVDDGQSKSSQFHNEEQYSEIAP